MSATDSYRADLVKRLRALAKWTREEAELRGTATFQPVTDEAADYIERHQPESGREVFLCCGDGEGTHEFRVCATEQEVFAFYDYLCGQDQDGTLNSITGAFSDPDQWRNDGTMFELELYCAKFTVWKVSTKELALPSLPDATHGEG